MVWERAGTMLISCWQLHGSYQQDRTKSVAVYFFVDLFNPSLYMNTQISQHLPQIDVMSVEVSTNTAASCHQNSRQGGPRYKLRLPTGVFHDLWNSRTTRFKNPVPEEVIYYDRSSGVGRRPFAQPIQQTAWDNTLSSHQVNCWHTFRLSNIAMDNFTPIEFYRSLSPIIKPPFLEISQLAMFDCQSVVWQGPRRFNETTWGIPKHQPAGPRDPGHSADYPTRWTIPPLWASVFEEGWSKGSVAWP